MRWAVRALLGGRPTPLTDSLILTDCCNLHCRHCTVAHLGEPARTYEEVCRDVDLLYGAGARMVVPTGGEPFVWRDGPRTLEDVLAFARQKGFFRTVVCTNGTFPLVSSADYLWVSLDGAKAEHDALRRGHHGEVVANLRASEHPRIHANLIRQRQISSRSNLLAFSRRAEVHPGFRKAFEARLRV